MLDLLKSRRSIRKYRDKKIEPEKIEILKEAAVRSPSSRGRNPWRFIFVNRADKIKKLANSKQHGSQFLAGAPLNIIVLDHSTATDVWVEDCSIASIILQLTAQSLDLGSCWVQIRNRMQSKNIKSGDYIKNIFKIPDQYSVESIIGIGYPAEEKSGHPRESLEFDKIFENNFE